MRDVTLSHLDRLGAAAADERVDAFVMDDEAFRLFYDRTARPLWAYLARVTGDPRSADDLLQETYYRFLRARVAHETEAHSRHYLFRIATNVAHDVHRRPRADSVQMQEHAEPVDPQSARDGAARLADRLDVSRAMARLRPRDRSMLWLAYAQGSTHQEIARVLGQNGQRQADAVPGPEAPGGAAAGEGAMTDADMERALRDEYEAACRGARVPAAGAVFWRASIRARAEAARTADRPMTIASGLATAVVIGAGAAVAGIAWPMVATLDRWTPSHPWTTVVLCAAVLLVVSPLALLALAAREGSPASHPLPDLPGGPARPRAPADRRRD